MATSPASLTSWKLKETVKFMRLNASKKGDSQTQAFVRKDAATKKQEIKKWKKMDIYLFKYDTPVIKYCPTGDDISHSTCETLDLDGVNHVKYIPNSSKPNVLTISYSTYYLLLSFKSRSSMERWMSELLLSTVNFTFLLFETSNSSIKLGYYQLRLALGNYTIVACDAVTKKVEWSWHISDICGHSSEKSGVKIEVGKGSTANGTFCFVGKQMELFCEQLRIFGRKYSQKRSHSLPTAIQEQDKPERIESTVFRKRSFAMEKLLRLSGNHKSNDDDDSLTDSVFSENLTSHLSSPTGYSCAHTLPRLNIKTDMPSISESISTTDSDFSDNHIGNPSSPIVNLSSLSDNSTVEALTDSAKPDEAQINDDDDGSIMESKINTDNSMLSTGQSKSLDDLLKIVHKNTNLPKAHSSSSDLDKGNDSDEEDYVIPFLPNSDEDSGYVIASLNPCSTKYVALKSKSCVDSYAEIKDHTTLSLPLSTNCDDNFRTRSDSDAYDYVKDFTFLSPLISPSKTGSKHDAFTKLSTDINEYEEVKDYLQETPSLCSSTTCVKENDPIRTHSDSDYEKIKDILEETPSLCSSTACPKDDDPLRTNSNDEKVEETLQETPSVCSRGKDNDPIRTGGDCEEVKDNLVQE